jgi:hypothetical protein
MLTAQNGLIQTLLANAVAPSGTVVGPLSGAKIGLFINTPVITSGMLLADLTPPASPGMGLSAAITWGAVYTSTSGEPAVNSDLKAFIGSGTIVPESITGWYLVAGSGSPTVPLAVEMLTTPVGILHDGDGLSIVAVFSPSSADIGHGVVID